jgi:hypothetical protein
MSAIPSTTTLLQAVAEHLERDLLPTLDGYARFQTRIAVNLLHSLQREQALGAANAAAEQRRLIELLGHEGELAALQRELVQFIEQERIALDTPGLVEHLRQSLAEALAIHNPRWLA